MRRLVAALTALVVVAVPAQQARAGNAAGELTHLGQPILQVLSVDQALGSGLDGEPQAYFVVAGNANTPAEFAAVDIRTHRTVFDIRLPAGTTSWAVEYSAAERAVYFGMSDATGLLYRWRVGSTTVESLGAPIPGEQIWTIDIAPDGTVYGGTYPGGRLFSYDPASSSVHDFGQVIADETYLRSVEATATTVWFGTQPHAKFASMDRATGAVTPIAIPEPYASWGGAATYDIFDRGSRLFVRITGSGGSVMLVRDQTSNTWVNQIANPGTRAVSPTNPADGRTVYLRLSTGQIGAYDLSTDTYSPIGWAPNAIPGDFAWIDMANPEFPGLSLAFTYYYGRIYVLNLATRKGDYHQAQVMGAANPLTAISTGPDGKVYVGAFLSPPGMSRLDPATGSFSLLSSAGQVEGYGVHNGRLLYGRYPGANLYRFDPARPWAMGTNPGAATAVGAEQDRPKAFASLDHRVAVGSVPVSGVLGGALSLWDPASGAIETHRSVIPDQSVVSLAVHGGVVYGGTSIYGGYGVDPVAKQALLFGFDPATGKVVYKESVVERAVAVSGLTAAPDGHLWGLAGTTLFEFDPGNRRIVHRKELFADTGGERYGDGLTLAFVGDRLFGTAQGKLFEVNPGNWHVTILDTTHDLFKLTAHDGSLYLIGGQTSVYRYTPGA